MKKLVRIVIYTLIILGIIHSTFAFVRFSSINADSIWFFGAGLTYIFIGLYNLSVRKLKIKAFTYMALFLNFIGTVFSIAIAYILKEPQTYVAFILVAFIFKSSFRDL
ncbi:MAG: hypothetical protein JEY96_04040 [Bacteroidales bacterium]|nr:hypothetical protein [Bacteroidales bacterium]